MAFPKKKKTKKKRRPVNKTTVTYWKKKAWAEFSIFVRLRDALLTTGQDDTLKCCSCGKTYPAFGRPCAQAGHLIEGRYHILLFDERAVNGQCYNCNITLKGNWVAYEKFMLKKWGQAVVDRCKEMKYIHLFKYQPYELEEIRDYYKLLHRTIRTRLARGEHAEVIELLENRKLDNNGRPTESGADNE